jgi:hypothetical protein
VSNTRWPRSPAAQMRWLVMEFESLYSALPFS